MRVPEMRTYDRAYSRQTLHAEEVSEMRNANAAEDKINEDF